MFDCFKNCWSALALRTPYTSSAPHRNAERGNGVTEILGSTLESLSPAASIPTKLAQTGISLFSIFRTDVHASEKIVHALQAGISAATSWNLSSSNGYFHCPALSRRHL